MKNSVEFNGLFFNEETPEKVKQIISGNVRQGKRFRFWYGDKETGKSWNDEYDVTGYIGKSTGTQKIPLLINNINSSGGGALMTNCIVKIVETSTKRTLYQHEKFNQPVFVAENGSDIKGYCAKVRSDSMIYSNHKSFQSAQRLADFMNGKRMCK